MDGRLRATVLDAKSLPALYKSLGKQLLDLKHFPDAFMASVTFLGWTE